MARRSILKTGAAIAELKSQSFSFAAPPNLCLHELVEAQVQKSPEAIAVQFENCSLTYAELNSRSNQLANLLRRLGVGRETLVGLCIERCLEMPVALLGILKAGGAYVPLDPAHGSGRIQSILAETRTSILITQQPLLASIAPISSEIVYLDAFQCERDGPVTAGLIPSNLAYVIHTSGSTGKPKGVQIEHRNLVNLLCSMQQRPGFRADDVLLALTTLAFDIAGVEMYLPLIVGGRIVIANKESTYNAKPLMALLERSQATVMQGTPTTWRLLVEGGWLGRRGLKALVGGESLPPGLARALIKRCCSVWNLYGPTETTIYSSMYPVSGRDNRIVPIGRPIANTHLCILDDNRHPVPFGQEGELYIGGDGLSRGYFEKPLLTAEKFVSDLSDVRLRMYRTGDLCRYRPDGNVEFLGRIDHQVKIRGFRVELGEIETVLEQHPAIRQAVVTMREHSSGEPCLTAYLVPRVDRPIALGDLRQYLRKKLPDYMMPAAFVGLASLPASTNGKVDRKALPAPRPSDFQADTAYIAPRDEIERKLTKLWESALGMHPVSITANFFDLGGTSLLASRLFIKISATFHKEVHLAALFQAPTVEKLALYLRSNPCSAILPTLVTVKPGANKRPFFCVHGGAGSTLVFYRLGRSLDSDQAFYAIEPEGLDGSSFQRSSVEEMATTYISEIRKIQPNGPYCLGGYCFGGLVAFEMAQQLRRRGEHVGLLALISSRLQFHRVEPMASENSGQWQGRTLRSNLLKVVHSPGHVFLWRTRQLFYRIQWSVAMTYLRIGLKVPRTLRTAYIAKVLDKAERGYVPNRYPGTLTLFRGRGIEECDANLGWDGLAERCENHFIGDVGLRSRRDILNEPLVAILARQLSDSLRESEISKDLPASAG